MSEESPSGKADSKAEAAQAAEQWSTQMPPPPHEKKKALVWPWVLLAALVAIAVPAAIALHKVEFEKKFWDIKYPGVEFLSATEGLTKHSRPYLGADVRFDKDVVAAADFQNFLAELVKQTKDHYEYYDIVAFNKRNQKVLQGTAASDGRFSITHLPDYESQ